MSEGESEKQVEQQVRWPSFRETLLVMVKGIDPLEFADDEKRFLHPEIPEEIGNEGNNEWSIAKTMLIDFLKAKKVKSKYYPLPWDGYALSYHNTMRFDDATALREFSPSEFWDAQKRKLIDGEILDNCKFNCIIISARKMASGIVIDPCDIDFLKKQYNEFKNYNKSTDSLAGRPIDKRFLECLSWYIAQLIDGKIKKMPSNATQISEQLQDWELWTAPGSHMPSPSTFYRYAKRIADKMNNNSE